jgi:hypothetical protein
MYGSFDLLLFSRFELLLKTPEMPIIWSAPEQMEALSDLFGARSVAAAHRWLLAGSAQTYPPS